MSSSSDNKPTDWYNQWADCILVVIVATIASGLAALLFASYYANPDLLWRDFYHDRNSHYRLGLDLAIALRNFDPITFFHELERAKAWPPFHGLVLSLVLSVTGIDHRFAIVPSLIGWVATIVFVWLITRALFRDRVPGIFAAATAVILTMASPAFRLLGSDVMLEGLGAGLSAFILWAYLRIQDEPQSKLHWRVLALALTALFFHKGNYWGLVIAALAADLIFRNVRSSTKYIGSLSKKAQLTAVAGNAWRDPLLVSFAIVCALALFIRLYWFDPSSINLFGFVIRIGGPQENLVTVAYAILFARGFLIWRQHRSGIDTALGLGGRTIFYWHFVPIAISFLLPKRLSTFIWFVGPSNSQTNADLLGGAVSYWNGFAEGFHIAPWMAVLSAILTLIGATQWRTLQPGARVVFLFVLLSAIAVIVHPQHQSRFLASWVFAAWICAGTGSGVIFAWIFSRRPFAIQIFVASAAIAGLALVMTLEKPAPRSFVHAIYPTSGPSDLDLVRPYLRDLEGASDISVATTFGMSRLFRWAVHENCKCNVIMTDLFIDSQKSREDVKAVMANRIANSNSDIFVIIDAPGSRYSLPVLGWTYEKMAGVVDAMASQTRYVRIANYPIPSHGANASVWRNDGAKNPR